MAPRDHPSDCQCDWCEQWAREEIERISLSNVELREAIEWPPYNEFRNELGPEWNVSIRTEV